MSNSQKDTSYTVMLAFFILTTAITITIFASYLLFAFNIRFYNLDQLVDMSYGIVYKNYVQMMDYLINPFNWHFSLSDFASSAAGFSFENSAIFLISHPFISLLLFYLIKTNIKIQHRS